MAPHGSTLKKSHKKGIAIPLFFFACVLSLLTIGCFNFGRSDQRVIQSMNKAHGGGYTGVSTESVLPYRVSRFLPAWTRARFERVQEIQCWSFPAGARLPGNFSGLPELSSFYEIGSHATGVFVEPIDFSNCPELFRVRFAEGGEGDIHSFRNCPKLREVEITYWKELHRIPDFSKCPSLTSIEIFVSWNFEDPPLPLPAGIIDVSSLTSFDLKGGWNKIESWPDLSRCRDLTSLKIDVTTLTDSPPLPNLATLFPKLETLELKGVESCELQGLESATNLHTLALEKVQLERFPNLPANLRHLTISGRNSRSPSTVLPALKHLTKLETLSLHHLAITELPELPSHLKNLRLTYLDISEIPQDLPKALEALRLHSIEKLRSIPDLELPELKSIWLSFCPVRESFRLDAPKLELIDFDLLPIQDWPSGTHGTATKYDAEKCDNLAPNP